MPSKGHLGTNWLEPSPSSRWVCADWPSSSRSRSNDAVTAEARTTFGFHLLAQVGLGRRHFRVPPYAALRPKLNMTTCKTVKDFATLLGRSPDLAQSEDVRGFRLRELADRHVFDHAPAQRADDGDAAVLSEVVELLNLKAGRPVALFHWLCSQPQRPTARAVCPLTHSRPRTCLILLGPRTPSEAWRLGA